MLRLVCHHANGNVLLVFGLSHAELHQLLNGEIFPVDLQELDVGGQAVLFASEDHLEMVRILERAGVVPEEVMAKLSRAGKGQIRHEWSK